ncbi:MAG: NAD(FAD)-utilizing dehydrogenase [Clostridia bacterium]|nr:NAD(FAD)-utilizing dehydrogenase [Clostridia bacterium]
MKYRIFELKLRPGESVESIPFKIKAKMKNPSKSFEIKDYKIIKESIDARDKRDIRFVYAADFDVEPEETVLVPSKGTKLQEAKDEHYEPCRLNEPPGSDFKRPVIAGFGPCGMFAGLILAEAGMNPVILERGGCMKDRIGAVERFWKEGVLDENTNVQFGEGGAGTFSDGKLTTGIKDIRTKKVLEEFVEAGASPEILFRQKPHIGSDVLREVVVNIRKKIQRLGGEICFDTRLLSLDFENGKNSPKLSAVTVLESDGSKREVETDSLILALGHSARDTVRELFSQGLHMEQKPFSIGFRIEHPQQMINRAQYGEAAEQINIPADYKLSYHCKNGRGVYTFCMCPGGEVITASSQRGGVVTNGMSMSARDGEFANSALLTDVRTADFESSHPLSGIDFQEKYERLAFENGGGNYKAPACTWDEFEKNTQRGQKLRASLPSFAVESVLEAMPHLGRKLAGFDSPGAILRGVETRSSSPVRITRGKNYQSSVAGVFPGGEGAGYAGGIMSAAVDGIRLAEQLIINFNSKGTN